MEKPLLIVGAGEFAEIAYEYFTYDSDYRVVGFAVEEAYLTHTECCGLPVVPFERVESVFDPAEHCFFAAITFTQLNRVRTRLYEAAREKGYRPASYISSRAFVWRNVSLGEHCFIFEHNVLQHQVSVGRNVVLWSGNHVGHRASIGDHCFVSSHVVISGYCTVGSSCFLGVNSTLGDCIQVGADCFLAAGTVLQQDALPGKIYKGHPAEPAKVGSLRFFRVPVEACV